MSTATLVVGSLVAAAGAVMTFALFVWAARRDGDEDVATQKRLGIRRRTRLGR